jgi:hypothetical protein
VGKNVLVDAGLLPSVVIHHFPHRQGLKDVSSLTFFLSHLFLLHSFYIGFVKTEQI